jgi:pimeloyl-ACP methyl ester carboxylesterase
VFFHGAGTFHGWAFAEPWTERYRVLIPHHPGYGDSGDLDGLREVHDLVLHYIELFDQLGLTADVNLVGFSLGGLIAARFAIEQKHRLARLVLVAPAGCGSPAWRSTTCSASRPRSCRAGWCTGWRRSCRTCPAIPGRRLHRRPLPGDPHHGDHAVGAALRPGAAPLAGSRGHPHAGGVG